MLYIDQVLFYPFRLLYFMERSNYLLLEAEATFPAFQPVVTSYVHMGQKVAFHVTVTVTDVGRIRMQSICKYIHCPYNFVFVGTF